MKKSVVNLSNPGQPVSTNGTLLQYTITIANNNLVPLETIALVDANSSNQEYVPDSTTNYSTLFTNPIADNASAPIFPLSSPGYTNALIEANSSVSFTYRFEVTNLTSGLITNLASIPSSVSGLTAGLDAETALPTVSYAAPVINFTTGGTGNGVNTSSYLRKHQCFCHGHQHGHLQPGFQHPSDRERPEHRGLRDHHLAGGGQQYRSVHQRFAHIHHVGGRRTMAP